MRKILFLFRFYTQNSFLCGILLLALGCKQPSTNINQVRSRLSADPERLSPFLSVDAVTQQLLSNLFQKVTDFDPVSLERKAVLVKNVPSMVRVDTGQWKGGISLTYELKDSARWDNGTPITANDYVFSLKIILNPYVNASVWRGYLENLLGDVQLYPENARKWTVFLRRPYINAESSVGDIFVLPVAFYDSNKMLEKYTIADLMDTAKVKKWMADTIASKSLKNFAHLYQSNAFFMNQKGISGSGAYELSEWLPNQKINFQRKTNWWARQDSNKMLRACAQSLNYIITKEDITALSMLKNGVFDVCGRLPSSEFLELSKQTKLKNQYDFISFPQLTIASVGFNLKNPKLSDKRVRRAIAHLFDTDNIIKNLIDGFGEPVTSVISPEKAYYNRRLKPLKLDFESAQKALAAAGWADSDQDGLLDKVIDGQKTPLVLRYTYGTNGSIPKNLGLLLKENAQKVGILIELNGVDISILKNTLKNRNFELVLKPIGGQYDLDDPKQLWHTSSDRIGGNNYFGFGDAKSDALIEKIRTELDPEKRRALYWQFQELLYEEQPAVFLFAVRERLAIHKRFHAEPCKLSPGYVPRFLCP